MKQLNSNDVLAEIFMPDNVIGRVSTFKNYNHPRIVRYEVETHQIRIYMTEIDRVDSG